ncbi:MAG: hypothetical protein ACLQVL_20545 [Terriglobia bacterium]
MGNPAPQEPPVAPEMKYCMDCGQQILRRAEICPRCGCRQLPPPRAGLFGGATTPSSSSTASSFGSDKTSKTVILLCLNFLWNGVGNLVVGDKNGWSYIFFNIIVFVVSLATFFVPSLLFFFYCCYQGYKHIEQTP